ncbi:MAG: low molecular weight phosphatase family protein [Halobacteriales archaeon]
MTETPIRIAFMCVQNAGRSQMAAAFARQEREHRGLEETVEILTGGTDPADHVHVEVITVMDEIGIDLSDRQPQPITTAQLESCTYVATMGCSTLDLDTDATGVIVRDWALDDPDGQPLDRIREIRDTIRERVDALFDEIEQELHTDA